MREQIVSRSCENCIHKEVCKFKDTDLGIKIEAPFEISCKHYMDKKPTLTYPYGNNWAIREINTAHTTMCDNCGFYDKTAKKCTIEGKPMGIVGLPCQTFTCSTESGI